MEIKDLRTKIDAIDDDMIRLFSERMDVAAQIAKYKKENGLPVLDAQREREKLTDVLEKAGDMGEYATLLYSIIFELSRAYQIKLLAKQTDIQKKVRDAIDNTERLFPQNASVACQGVEGAYSQLACEKLFKLPSILYFRDFENVFTAIESGLCRYGVIPIENSTAGSVKKVYDLMIKHDFSIVRSVRIKVDHNLLAKKGTKLENVKEIFSHEQAIGQCVDFLKNLGSDVKITAVENTAAAAKMVAESGRDDVAAIASRSCIELYGLACLESSIQDAASNFTRFICISKNLEIYPGADRTSIMLVTPHKAGALYKVMSRFYALGINLNKLESRPIPDRDFEFMFYFDLDTSVYSEQFIQLLGELQTTCEEFKYLGSYSEVV